MSWECVSASNPAQVYRLSEDLGGRYALYLSTGLPGKSQPPHDHTTWAIIAGVEGVERNVFFTRGKTDDPLRDTLAVGRSVEALEDHALGHALQAAPVEVQVQAGFLADQLDGVHVTPWRWAAASMWAAEPRWCSHPPTCTPSS